MIRLFSPAKINLFFKIMGLRKDGFHNLHSFFQAINLGDELSFAHSHKDNFTSTEPSLKFNHDNFIYRALMLFREKTHLKDPVQIDLIKNIPIEAGLGGGSSNIATTLWGLNELFDRPVSKNELFEVSKTLGSDVPFFFSTGSAVCSGRGEEVLPMKMPLEEMPIWVVKPNVSLSTKEVYTYAKKKSSIKESLETLSELIYSKSPILKNDLEEAAFLLCPTLALLKDELEYQGFKKVFMSGSGTSYVCMGENKPVFKNPVKVFPVKYINRKPNEWYQKEIYEYSNR